MPEITITKTEDINRALNWADGMILSALRGGSVVMTLGRPEDKKSSSQNRKFHAMINDINKQAVFYVPGKRIVMSDYDSDQAKALLVMWFANEREAIGEPLPKPPRNFLCPVTGQQISIRPSTVEWKKSDTASFVEFLYMTGTMGKVKWSEPALKEYESWSQEK